MTDKYMKRVYYIVLVTQILLYLMLHSYGKVTRYFNIYLLLFILSTLDLLFVSEVYKGSFER